jgi:hypothetical protein
LRPVFATLWQRQDKKGVSAMGTAEDNFSSGGRTLEREDCMKLFARQN